MNKKLLILTATILVTVGAGCSTTSNSVDETVNTYGSAVEEAENATDAMEEKMEEQEELMEESMDQMMDEEEDNEEHGHAADEDAMHMMDAMEVDEDTGMMKMTDVEKEAITELEYDITGTLEDVAGGTGTGTASASFTGDMYRLYVTMENLPALEDGYFYEGWVVRPEPFAFISTGEVVQEEDGTWTNTYQSETDYLEYTNYVLTLEPDDGDPSPAEHILEGTME